jgi:hypothetical protein
MVWPQSHSDGFSSVWASKPMATVCEWFFLKTTQTVFTDLASKPVATVPAGLASKLVVTVFSGLASKPMVMVSSGLASKPAPMISGGLALKPATMVSPGLASKPMVGFLVEPQNQGGGEFLGLGLKISSFGLVI